MINKDYDLVSFHNNKIQSSKINSFDINVINVMPAIIITSPVEKIAANATRSRKFMFLTRSLHYVLYE